MWDYPRPPALSPTAERVRVVHRGYVLAETTRAVRVLETSQPPGYYIPRDDVADHVLVRSDQRTVCEWKGVATYWSIDLRSVGGDSLTPDAAWSYEAPGSAFARIAGFLAFYAQAVDECWVDDERVAPNPGSFYGGWITSRLSGPFKGTAGTQYW